jgi:prophage tail gpP-like protein
MRPVDRVRVESEDGGSFDVFNSLTIVNDFLAPAEAAFEVGDDGTWSKLEPYVGMGKKFKVFVNDRLRLTGRVELSDVPTDASNGSVTRFTVRTLMADAMYASADPKTKVMHTTLKQFILHLWEPLGLTEDDFEFRADVSRNLMTGKAGERYDGYFQRADLEYMYLQQAKVNPPESIFQATDRHLSRNGLMMWDSVDGKIVIGAPDDEQRPTYAFRQYADHRRQYNNILSSQRTRDWSAVPAIVGVYGAGAFPDWTKAHVRGYAIQAEVQRSGMYRPVLILNSSTRTDALANRQAAREMTARSMNFDTWTITVDGLSYWDGSRTVNYAIDTVADVFSTAVGGPLGSYLVQRVQMSRNPTDGDKTELTLLKKGIWRL